MAEVIVKKPVEFAKPILRSPASGEEKNVIHLTVLEVRHK
jgi:hypothetical protein